MLIVRILLGGFERNKFQPLSFDHGVRFLLVHIQRRLKKAPRLVQCQMRRRFLDGLNGFLDRD